MKKGVTQIFSQNERNIFSDDSEYEITEDGDLAHFSKYEGLSIDAYTELNNRMGIYGLLYDVSFQYPKEVDIQRLKTQGFDVSQKGEYTEARSTDMIIKWYKANSSMTIDYMENGEVFLKENITYEYNKEENQHLLKKMVLRYYETFSNGDPYLDIREKTYSDYVIEHNNKSRTKDYALLLQANPVADLLVINNILEDGTITIYGIDGSLLHQRKVKAPMAEINVKDLKTGTYVVTYTSENQNTSSKFIKQ